jgi:hypothetical protein
VRQTNVNGRHRLMNRDCGAHADCRSLSARQNCYFAPLGGRGTASSTQGWLNVVLGYYNIASLADHGHLESLPSIPIVCGLAKQSYEASGVVALVVVLILAGLDVCHPLRIRSVPVDCLPKTFLEGHFGAPAGLAPEFVG